MDTSERTNYIRTNGLSTILQDIPFNNKKITGLGSCTSDNDAANKAYVDNLVATSSSTPTQIINGDYRVRVLSSGKCQFSSVSGGNSLVQDLTTSFQVAAIYPSDNGLNTGFLIKSNQGNGASAITLYRVADQNLPI
jgi:hypothetical protein